MGASSSHEPEDTELQAAEASLPKAEVERLRDAVKGRAFGSAEEFAVRIVSFIFPTELCGTVAEQMQKNIVEPKKKKKKQNKKNLRPKEKAED